MAKDRRSRDQKRQAKLAERAKKISSQEKLAYSGKKYQAPPWTPHVFATERAVYQTIVLTERRLTNAQVEAAFTQLIARLRQGLPGPLQEGAEEVLFSEENAVAYLMWNIRRNWALLVQEQGPVSTEDLIGILRTLLYSIIAHAWNTGPSRGYVAFLYDFLRGQV